MAHLLDSTRLKIGRARERLHEIDREAAVFLDAQPYLVVPYQDGDSDQFVMRCRVFAPPPINLGLMAGDFAHNLRASLDHLIYQLAALGDKGEKGRGQKTQFPICDELAEFERLKGKYLKGMLPADQTRIRDLQPIDRPESLLRTIRDLDNRDKHKTVDPVLSIARTVRLSPQVGTTIHEVIPTPVPPDQSLQLNDGAVLGTYRASASEGEVRVNFELQPGIAFRFVEKRAVQLTQFPRMVSMVISILGQFSPSFDVPVEPDHTSPPEE